MSTRTTFDVPKPEGFDQPPAYRYWGERKPPTNRAEFWRATAAEETSGTGTDVGTKNVATLRMYGPIDSWGGYWGISARDVSEALDTLGDVDEIRVRINSPGGEVWEGMAILNMLRAHPASVTAIVDGLAASAASFIATGCDETVMSPGTQMMIHDASAFAYGPAATMRQAAKFLDSTSNAIASIYAESAGGTEAEWRAVMQETTWYTANEAVTSKLADRVAVVADAGSTSTAGEDDQPELDESEVENHFDLSLYPHAGRSKAPAPKPPNAAAIGFHHTEGGSAVAFSDEHESKIRALLGLPEDADEAAVNAAIERTEEKFTAPPAPPTAKVPEGMALIEADVLADLRNGVAAGREAAATLAKQERDKVIASAIATGKVTASRREHWEKSWAADAEGTKTLLDSLEPGLAVPVNELGLAGESTTKTDDDALYELVFGEQKGA